MDFFCVNFRPLSGWKEELLWILWTLCMRRPQWYKNRDAGWQGTHPKQRNVKPDLLRCFVLSSSMVDVVKREQFMQKAHCSWVCGQIVFCLKGYINEAKVSIQSRIDPFTSLILLINVRTAIERAKRHDCIKRHSGFLRIFLVSASSLYVADFKSNLLWNHGEERESAPLPLPKDQKKAGKKLLCQSSPLKTNDSRNDRLDSLRKRFTCGEKENNR